MIWKVYYIVDDGYQYLERVAIVKAESEEKALEFLDTEIGSKLKGKRFIVKKYTRIFNCGDGPILYKGIAMESYL